MNEERISVFDAFFENKYNRFLQYCAQNGITYVDELTAMNFDFDSLLAVKGMGAGKVNLIKERYEEIIAAGAGAAGNDVKTVIIEENVFSDINEQIRPLDIDFLSGFGIKEKMISELKEAGVVTVGDLETVPVKRLKLAVGYNGVDKLKSLCNKLSNNIKSNLENKLVELSDTEHYQMTLFRAEGYTLKEVGELKNVTRERTRQLVNKLLSSLDPFMKPVVKGLIEENGYFSEQDFLDYYDNQDFNDLIIFWCKNSDILSYLSFAGKFVSSDYPIEKINADLLKIGDDLISDGADINLIADEAETALSDAGYGYIKVEDLVEFLTENGYRKYNNFVVKGRQSYAYLCARVIAEHFKNGIKLYESEDLDKLRELVLQEFGDIGVSDDNRALSTRLSEYTVISGRGYVTAEENVYIEMSLLDEIFDCIEKAQESEIYYSEVYAKFEAKLKLMSNIDNYYFLHGVLKLYYSDVYDFSNRDYLIKKGEGLKSGKLSDKIHGLIINAGSLVLKSEIKKAIPGLTEIALANAVVSSKDVFLWEYNTYYSLDLLTVTEGDKESLSSCIRSITENNGGYCSDNLLYELVSEKMPEFLAINKIQKAITLYYVCEKLLSDFYDFRRPHISTKGLFKDFTLKGIALHFLKYPELLSYSEFTQLSKKMMWSESTVSLLFCDIEKDYIRISADNYVKKEAFDIDRTLLPAIEAAIRKSFSMGYVSISSITDWSNFPEIQYEWNSFVLRSIIDKYISSVKIIESDVTDRRYEKGIVMDKLNPIDSYSALVAAFLRANGITEIGEPRLRTLLSDNNLISAYIPKEIYSCDAFEYKDGKFIIR